MTKSQKVQIVWFLALQCILLKAALLLGVHFHFNATFESICDPNPNDLNFF